MKKITITPLDDDESILPFIEDIFIFLGNFETTKVFVFGSNETETSISYFNIDSSFYKLEVTQTPFNTIYKIIHSEEDVFAIQKFNSGYQLIDYIDYEDEFEVKKKTLSSEIRKFHNFTSLYYDMMEVKIEESIGVASRLEIDSFLYLENSLILSHVLSTLSGKFVGDFIEEKNSNDETKPFGEVYSKDYNVNSVPNTSVGVIYLNRDVVDDDYYVNLNFIGDNDYVNFKAVYQGGDEFDIEYVNLGHYSRKSLKSIFDIYKTIFK